MTMLPVAFSNLVVPGLAKVTSDKFQALAKQAKYKRIFEVKSSKKQYEEGLLIEGFGAAVEKNVGNPVEFVDLTEGYKTTWTHATYARGTRIAQETYDDDLYKVFSGKLSTYLSRSIYQRAELVAASVFNNGFTTTGADGKALFATDHPYKSGGTYSNLLSTAADLSETALEAMITLLETTKDAGSIDLSLVAKKLIINPKEKFNARRILKSNQQPGTANNDTNALKEENLELIIWHFITDIDSFYLQGDQHSLVYWNRQKPKIESGDDFDTGDAKIKVTMRCSAGYDDPRGMVGTPGGD